MARCSRRSRRDDARAQGTSSAPAALAGRRRRGVARFVAAFALAVALLAVIRVSGAEHVAAEAVGRWIAAIVAVVLRPLEPGMSVAGNVLSGPGGSLRVAEECSGFELIGLLAAAMLAYPIAWRRKLAGLALVIPFVLALNVVRVASLSLALEYSPASFDMLHTVVWQGMLILAGLGYWVAWSGAGATA